VFGLGRQKVAIATNPGFGSAGLFGQIASAFFCAPVSVNPVPLLNDDTVGPILTTHFVVRRAKASRVTTDLQEKRSRYRLVREIVCGPPPIAPLSL
jgi:hypothetical protein